MATYAISRTNTRFNESILKPRTFTPHWDSSIFRWTREMSEVSLTSDQRLTLYRIFPGNHFRDFAGRNCAGENRLKNLVLGRCHGASRCSSLLGIHGFGRKQTRRNTSYKRLEQRSWSLAIKYHKPYPV